MPIKNAILLMMTMLLCLGHERANASPGISKSDLVVIVHANTSVERINRQQLASIFLKKMSHWPSGEAAKPVDQVANAQIRHVFDEEMLSRSVAAVKNYWTQLIFSGRDMPPPELPTDAHVIAYVSKHPGAVGYVSKKSLPEGVKVLTVE